MKILIPIIFLLSSPCYAQGIIESIIKEAKLAGVDPYLAVAIARTESSLNPNAIGKHGEIGLFQLRPEYHDIKHASANTRIKIAMKYLAYLKTRCYSKYGNAWFICYNTGPNRSHVIQDPEMFPYYTKVINHYEKKQARN